jgi:hypothetical protein
MNANEVKKELYKSKVNAKFSHYIAGNLYYTVELETGTYQFSLETVDVREVVDKGWDGIDDIPKKYSLSSDLGTTSFENEMKASDLNRWIVKAIESDNFIKIK